MRFRISSKAPSPGKARSKELGSGAVTEVNVKSPLPTLKSGICTNTGGID